MTIELGQQIGAFLAAQHVMSVATLGPSGPHATSLFYACDGLALVWVSEPDSQHSREIEADPRVAATVAPFAKRWDGHMKSSAKTASSVVD
jgi:uncharacterized protein YhbP (UPF0306 family)